MEKRLVYIGKVFGMSLWLEMSERNEIRYAQKLELVDAWFGQMQGRNKPKMKLSESPEKQYPFGKGSTELPGQLDIEEELKK